jgi:hypothetical protein
VKDAFEVFGGIKLWRKIRGDLGTRYVRTWDTTVVFKPVDVHSVPGWVKSRWNGVFRDEYVVESSRPSERSETPKL